MPNKIIQEFASRMEARIQEITDEFMQKLDFKGLEAALNEECAKLNAELQQLLLQNLLLNLIFLNKLRIYAGKLGMRFKEYRRITVTLSNGQKIEIISPYFVKAEADKRRRKRKRGPNGTGSHIGLKVVGFIGLVSPGLLSDAVQTALLCPSFEVAHTVLKGRGIKLDVKTLRRLCQLAGVLDNELRGRISLSGDENLQGHTLVISADGGRLRERRRKRGRKTKDLKRHGYHTNWREPKLFTIYLLDEKGDVVKKFKPLHDATMENHDGMFALLESYLRSLKIEQLARIVFCGDGGQWIWNGVEELCTRMNLDKKIIYQVLDYTHAKQNLNEIVELVKTSKQSGVRKKWETMLWNGQHDELERSIKDAVTGKDKIERAMNKFTNYFATNRERMRYAYFKEHGLPCGSGYVESAIRRVINLRLKAPGTFWLKEMAECFLFLRSQLLSGRWEIFMQNLISITKQVFLTVCADYSSVDMLQNSL